MIKKILLVLTHLILISSLGYRAFASECSYKVRETSDELILTVKKNADEKELNFSNGSDLQPGESGYENYGNIKDIAIPRDLLPLQDGVHVWRYPDSFHVMRYENGVVSIKTKFTFGKTDSISMDGEIVEFKADRDFNKATISNFKYDKIFGKLKMSAVSQYWPNSWLHIFDDPWRCGN